MVPDVEGQKEILLLHMNCPMDRLMLVDASNQHTLPGVADRCTGVRI